MDRNNYGNGYNNNYGNYNSSGMRDRGERHNQDRRPRDPRDQRDQREQRQQRQPREQREQRQQRGERGDRGDYRGNDRRAQYERYGGGSSSSSLDNGYNNNGNNYNRQYNNNSSSSIVTSSTNLLQSPLHNPYKIDSNTSKVSVLNDPSKDKLETYAKLKQISPVKFYISLGISLVILGVTAIIGLMAMSRHGLSGENINDVNIGMAQGYLFYCGFLIIAIFTGVYAFIKKWNNLLVTYLSFLFVSCLYLCYFSIELLNISRNTLTVMDKRWKHDFDEVMKERIQDKLSCCGYYTADDDPGKSGECVENESLRKRFFLSNESSPIYYSPSLKLRKRTTAEEGSCAKAIESLVKSNLKIYIIIFVVLLLINIGAVVVTILDIKQYAEILKELSNPFA